MQDAPVECTRLFHERATAFMDQFIKSEDGILGKVTDWVIRYEVQGRG